MSSEFDDLLGGDAPTVRRGRPTNAMRAERAAAMQQDAAFQREVRMAGQGKGEFQPEDFYGLCSQNQIARLLHMDPMTVKKRLGRCKAAGTVGNGRPVYYFHEAIPYLIKPKMDLATYLRTLNAADLPNSINKAFWEAEKIKNRVLLETGESWADGDVLAVLGEVFMMFKDRIPIITEGMREAGLTDEQYKKLTGFSDQLQTDLHAALVELPARRRTLPRLASIDPGDEPSGTLDDSEFDEGDAE